MMISIVLALAIAQTPEKEDNWAQYTRAPTSKRIYGWSANASTSTSAAYVESDGDLPLVLRWGSQIKVTCRGGSSTDIAMMCLTMDPAMTFGHEPSMGGGDVCDGGCGVYDDSGGPSGVNGPLPCFVLGSGSVVFERIAKGSFTRDGLSPTYRAGRCVGAPAAHVGAPCDDDDECESGDCVVDGIGASGTFLIGQATSTSMTCVVESKL